MTKPSQSWFKRFFYNQNIKRDKSGKKYKNLINHSILLIKRVDKNGMDARLLDALAKAKKKILAYGIALYQVETIMKHKWLDKLIPLFQTTLGGDIKVAKVKVAKTPVAKKIVEKKEVKAPVVKKVIEKKEIKKMAEKKEVVKKEIKAPVVKKAAATKVPKTTIEKKPSKAKKTK